MTGRITALHSGYGFINADDGERLFFGADALRSSSVRWSFLAVGDVCTFTRIEHERGPRAVDVFVADPNQIGLPL